MLSHAPGVQIQSIREDCLQEEFEDEDAVNADRRNPQSLQDKRIIGENEFSDSEDEGPVSSNRKDNRSFKNTSSAPSRKKPRLEPIKSDAVGKTDDLSKNDTKEDREDSSAIEELKKTDYENMKSPMNFIKLVFLQDESFLKIAPFRLVFWNWNGG